MQGGCYDIRASVTSYRNHIISEEEADFFGRILRSSQNQAKAEDRKESSTKGSDVMSLQHLHSFPLNSANYKPKNSTDQDKIQVEKG